MMYLFCNQEYGQPFLVAAKEYSQKNSIPITIVISSKKKHRNFSWLKNKLRDKFKQIRLIRYYEMKVLLVDDVNSQDFRNKISPNDHGVIAGFNQIFNQKTIDLFKSLVNFHPSVLPLYRGPVPSYWCLKNGESKSGYTLHRVVEKIDAGEILFQESIDISEIHESSTLDQAIAQKAVLCFLEYLECFYAEQKWNSVKLDANKIYKSTVEYASFPIH
jgi:methionyl-tRNA formyltransferase